jgi:hypothetical protein
VRVSIRVHPKSAQPATQPKDKQAKLGGSGSGSMAPEDGAQVGTAAAAPASQVEPEVESLITLRHSRVVVRDPHANQQAFKMYVHQVNGGGEALWGKVQGGVRVSGEGLCGLWFGGLRGCELLTAGATPTKTCTSSSDTALTESLRPHPPTLTYPPACLSPMIL